MKNILIQKRNVNTIDIISYSNKEIKKDLADTHNKMILNGKDGYIILTNAEDVAIVKSKKKAFEILATLGEINLIFV